VAVSLLACFGRRNGPIIKMREGQITGLGLPPLKLNNQLKDNVSGGGGIDKEMRPGRGTCGGGRLPAVYGGRIEQRKNENQERDGALD
jgi:hypothetical protein